MVIRTPLSRAEILQILDGVPDPEVPALSIVDLGIVRDVAVDESGVTVVVTPTYSGCPAMQVIEEEIVRTLEQRGAGTARIRTVYSPAWTTDWMSDDAKRRLEEYGIAPPAPVAREGVTDLVSLRRRGVRCPFCHDVNTTEKSAFGSTACKALWYCNRCHQPFEAFKPL